MGEKFKGYLIASDLDGTLLNSKREISAENRAAIEYFQREGGIFSLATGRAYQTGGQYSDVANGPSIFLNGAMVYDTVLKNALWKCPLRGNVRKMLENINSAIPTLGIEVWNEDSFDVLYRKDASEMRFQGFFPVPDIISVTEARLPCLGLTIVGEKEKIDEAFKWLRDNYSEEYHFIRAYDFMIEVLGKSANKGTALMELAKILGISKDKVLAVGDDINDIEMLKAAGVGFVPNNAKAEIKAFADVVIPSNDEHVVVNIIRHIENLLK